MPEPISSTTTAAVGAVGAVAVVQAFLGVDPSSVLWGLAGGMAALTASDSMGRWAALGAVTSAAVLAGASTEFLAFYLHQQFVSAPHRALLNLVAFGLGLASQGIIRWAVRDGFKTIRGWLAARVGKA